MTVCQPVKIIGTGIYLPKKVNSREIETRYGLPEGWSERMSGVRNRHHVDAETNGFMAARAIEKALEKCRLSLSDIDLLISASATHDYPIPNGASVIKSELKNGSNFSFPAIDIDTTCLSFVTAFEIAASLLDGGKYKRIIIVSSEISSIGLNPKDWKVLTLFGDAAAAVVLEYDPNSNSSFIKSENFNFCEGIYDTIIRGGGTKNWFKSYDSEMHSFSMNGKNLLRLGKTKLTEFIEVFFRELDIGLEDVDVIIPHQASKVGLALFKKQYDIKEGKIKESLLDHGNCIAASIPLTLCNAIENGELIRGNTCFLFGTSAGFSIGGVLIRY